MLTVVIQAYGRQDIIDQAIFSAITLLSQTKKSDLTLIFYTDQIKSLSTYFSTDPRVKFEEVTPELLKKWRGDIDFVHRVKIECLIDAGKKNPGDLFYIDGDTIFTKNPEQLFSQISDQKSLMHIAEATLKDGKDPLSKKLKKFVKKNFFELENGVITIPDTTLMWNAGVIGISEKNKAQLPKILNLTDVAYRKYQKHVIEQLAVSFFLQKSTQVVPANNEILHYWNQKQEYQKKIDDFLKANKTLEDALKNVGNFKMISAPAEDRPKKALAKILGRIFK